MSTLVIVPCGAAKLWKKDPRRGAVPARDAYVGAPFKVNREYAQRFADRWLILSAKYGLIEPETLINDYNVTFNDPTTGPVSIHELAAQVQDHPGHFDLVIALGGRAYAEAVRLAFVQTGARVVAPAVGLPIGKAMGLVRRAIDQGKPFS